MKVFLDGKQIVVEDAPGYSGKIIDITASHCRMTQSATVVTVVDGLYDTGYTDLIANIVDGGDTSQGISYLRGIIG